MVVDKVRRKLGSWKGKLMSRAARNILINSVTSAIPSYYMQAAAFPKSTIEELERLNRKFLWGDEDQKRKLYTVSWEVICRPREDGGLGIKRLKDVNQMMLCKLGWRMLQEPHKLWSKILWHKYGNLFQPTKKQNVSFIWQSLWSIRDLLMAEIDWGSTVPEQFQPEDGVMLSLKSNGSTDFSPQGIYKQLRGASSHSKSAQWKRVWKVCGPQRYNFILWQIRHDRLPTSSLLFNRYSKDDPFCPFCGCEIDTTLHAIRDCSWVRKVWKSMLQVDVAHSFWTRQMPKEWVDDCLSNSEGLCREAYKGVEWNVLFRAAVAKVWYLRNKMIHDDTVSIPDARQIANEIRSKRFECIKSWKDRKLTLQDVCTYIE